MTQAGSFEVRATAIPDVSLIRPRRIADARGHFMQVWHAQELAGVCGEHVQFAQINQSLSRRGTLRGLHYQVARPQGKLVRTVSGSIFDVAVDLRRDSPTFGQWAGAELNAEQSDLLWIPPGFAHGFCVTSDEAVVEYCCTDFYAPELERVVRWDDPDLAIGWPLPAGARPLLSERDAGAPRFRDAEYL